MKRVGSKTVQVCPALWLTCLLSIFLAASLAVAWALRLHWGRAEWDFFGGLSQTGMHTRLYPLCLSQATWRKESFGHMYWGINCTSLLSSPPAYSLSLSKLRLWRARSGSVHQEQRVYPLNNTGIPLCEDIRAPGTQTLEFKASPAALMSSGILWPNCSPSAALRLLQKSSPGTYK